MKRKKQIVQATVMFIAVLALSGFRVDAGIFNKKKSEIKEFTRLEQLRINHASLIQKRADVIRALQDLEKKIIKVEGQIEEQKWIDSQK